MSGTPNTLHINGCLTEGKLNQGDLKSIPNKDKCLKENQSDSIYNTNRIVEVEILKEQNCLSQNLKNHTILNGDENLSNGETLKKKKEKRNHKISSLQTDNSILLNKDESIINCKENEISVHKEDNSDVKELSDSSQVVNSEDKMLSFSKVLDGIGEFYSSWSNTSEKDKVIYYAVYIPNLCYNLVSPAKDSDTIHVYTDRFEALKVMKQNKKARLKQFKSRKEAYDFAINGSEVNTESASSATGGEKLMPFKCPKPQDMVHFRKAIECREVNVVTTLIWENPRYLVSNGDTPSILQEGSRYNALHVAAKSKNAEIAKLILDSITNVEFISYLYDDNDAESCRARSEVLLDLYLNMPDKGCNETPLHIAVKFGAVEVVELLLSYPQCQRNLPNKFHQTPKDIVCARVNGECESMKKIISAMLEDNYFIPVLRYEDNSMQPRIGEVFSPNDPLKLDEDPLSPRLEIQAYAGPMNRNEAELFKKKWKTPPRKIRDLRTPTSARLCDVEKGLEKIGRNLASEFKVPWKEYWAFLDTFVDITSEEGLLMLENYLKRRFEETLETTSNYDEKNDSDLADALSPISDLCEAFKTCSLSDDHVTSTDVPGRKKLLIAYKDNDGRNNARKQEETFDTDGKQPLLYVERSCEVFGRRIATDLFRVCCSTADVYSINTESLRDCLEPEVKHLLSLVASYLDDDRFKSVNFKLVHSRVASVASQVLKEQLADEDKSLLLASLKEIDLSDGTLSDDEDQNYNVREINHELLGATTKQHLHCLIKNLIDQLENSALAVPILSSSARSEKHCHRLWAHATPCSCFWSNSVIRTKIGAKRKSFKILKSSLDCDNFTFRRNLQFDDEKDNVEKTDLRDEEDEDYFGTPPSHSSESESESESEAMEDPNEVPDTFIYPGSMPTKTDFAVLEAIDRVPLSSEKYPNIYRWRHLVQLHSKFNTPDKFNLKTPEPRRRKKSVSFNSSCASPFKLLNESFNSSCDSPIRNCPVEPWERITGPYTPRRAKRSASSFSHQDLSSPR